MKCFVWQSATGITTHWHDGGGVLAIAKDEYRARELAYDHVVNYELEDWQDEEDRKVLQPRLGEVTKSWEVPAESEEFVMLFENSGCC